ncbi:MAG: glycosyltransferase family 2 protein [Elusimicrobiota bacterium]
MIEISALIIAKDEQADLPGCLESLKGLAEEIVVVVDEDSSDKTEELARSAGAKILKRRFDDYARQRQASLYLAAKDWCLWIDADERVSPRLADAIRAELSAPKADAYSIAFEVWFLGQRMRWGGLGRERHVRLFRRDKAHFTGGALHEGLEIDGSLADLKGPMIHIPYRDLAEYEDKLDRYTSLAADKRFAAGKRFRPWHHLIWPWELFSRTVLKGGFLDGKPGLTWARLSAFHSWLKYAKLRQLDQKK